MANTRGLFLAFRLALVAHLAVVGFGRADQRIEPEDPGNPYCGLYCVYGALKAVGKHVEFSRLLQHKYLSSPEGSSLLELSAALSDAGAFSVAMSDLTAATLRQSRFPIILHVSSDLEPREYKHWVLFLGLEGEEARIVDPPSSTETISFARLLARWDGKGLIVSSHPISQSEVASPDRWDLLSRALGIAALVFAIRALVPQATVSRQTTFQAALAQSLILTIGALAAGLGYHAFSRIGFLANRDAVRMLAEVYLPTQLNVLTADEIATEISAGNVVIVDARYHRDYRAGRIDGAINIPINASLGARRSALQGVSKGTKIVVYCQSLWLSL